MFLKLLVLLLILVALPIWANTEAELQAHHRYLLEKGKDSWLLQGSHSFMVSFTGKEEKLASVYHLENSFSLYRRLPAGEMHTKAVLSLKNNNLLIDVVHEFKEAKLAYSVKLITDEDIALSVKAEKQKQKILQILAKEISQFSQAAKLYSQKPHSENCLRFCSVFSGIDIALMAPYVFEQKSGGWTDYLSQDYLSQGWGFNSDWKGPAVKKLSDDTVIIYQEVLIYENKMSAEVRASGVGTNISIISLTNWAHPIPADPRYWYVNGGCKIYYQKR